MSAATSRHGDWSTTAFASLAKPTFLFTLCSVDQSKNANVKGITLAVS
ncbi:MAG: hypothetical protein P0120_10130 [Nitrospira sp.]|nr:hypothetical protein [Nitrospira sp.]